MELVLIPPNKFALAPWW